MLIKASHEITKISDNDLINSSNYFESFSYINNLYFFISKLSKIMTSEQGIIVFKPTFKGINTCRKFGIASDENENKMRCFVISSKLFLEDKEFKKKLTLEMGKFYDIISNEENNEIKFILR